MSRYNKKRRRKLEFKGYKPVEHPQQMRFLGELLRKHKDKELHLTQRQLYVVMDVIKRGEYTANYKHHLNKMRDMYGYVMDKIS